MTTIYILIAIPLYFALVRVIAKFCAQSRWERGEDVSRIHSMWLNENYNKEHNK